MVIERNNQNKDPKIGQNFVELHEIKLRYQTVVEETFEVLKVSKDFIEFQKRKGSYNEKIYSIRLKSLINMASVYFIALFEGFTRSFIKKIVYIEYGIEKKQFDQRYFKFNDILNNILREKFHINLNKQFKKWDVIKELRNARNQVVHNGKNMIPDFQIVKICFEALIAYFNFIESQILNNKSR